MYDSRPTRQTSLSPRLRRQYGLRLIREPLATTAKVPARAKIGGPADLFRFMQAFVAQELAESFWAIPLDVQHQAMAPVTITRGILSASLVHPREVFRAMIMANAASVVLCHNHPSGDPTASADDRRITTQLAVAGRLLDLPVIDHVIVAEARYFSFAENGLL